MKRLGRLLLLALLLIPSRSVDARQPGEDQVGELYSVEQRDLLGTHELSASVGFLPLDAFVKGITLQGSYTYNFTNLIGWEVVGGMYSFNVDTGLEGDLKDQFNVVPEREEEVKGFVWSNFVFRPLYGKLATINRTLLAAEIFFVLGPTLGFKSASKPFGFDVGGGVRFFVGRHFSIRFDIRDYLLVPGFSDVENNLHLSLGMSLSFGFADERIDEE